MPSNTWGQPLGNCALGGAIDSLSRCGSLPLIDMTNICLNDSGMRVVSVVGARPQFVKLGPIVRSFATAGDIDHVVVHTGQHYDVAMSEVFFDDLHIPTPDVNLGVGSGSHGVQTGAILSGLDTVLDHYRPDWVLVYGDTNSTIAAALSAVKLHIPVAHLEAGLRSFNRRMPEEHNRVLTDHAADLLLAPSELAMRNLAREGLTDRAIKVGDVMTDVCLRTRDAVLSFDLELPEGIDPSQPYLVATIHRAENTDDRGRLVEIVNALRDLVAPVLLIAHPRLLSRASSFGLELRVGALRVTSPLSYPRMVRAIISSAGVITDSGGLQKEAYLLGVPCTTLRSETEWIETLEDGWNILDPNLNRVHKESLRERPTAFRRQPYGDGNAAARVLSALRLARR